MFKLKVFNQYTPIVTGRNTDLRVKMLKGYKSGEAVGSNYGGSFQQKPYEPSKVPISIDNQAVPHGENLSRPSVIESVIDDALSVETNQPVVLPHISDSNRVNFKNAIPSR